MTSPPFTIELRTSGQRFAVGAGETILQVLERHGVGVQSLCRQGICGTCETALLTGAETVEHRDAYLTDAQRLQGDSIMICTSRATPGAHLTLNL